MRTTNLWLTIKTDRNDLEVVINDIPALRLGSSAGLQAPVNEYTVAGLNTLTVRLSPYANPDDGPQAVDVDVELKALTFEGETRVGDRTVAQQQSREALVSSGALLSLSFTYDRAGLGDLSGLKRLAPGDAPLVMSALDAAAAAWRAKQVQPLADLLEPYFSNYGRAYPAQSAADMRARFVRMATAFTSREHTVQYDPAQTRLDPCGGGRLVDAYGPDGAAIRILRPGAPAYDFWTVWGVQDGRAKLIL